MPRLIKKPFNVRKIPISIKAHAQLTEASIKDLSGSLTTELKGLRTDLREYLSQDLIKSAALKAAEEALVKRIEVHTTSSDIRNDLLKQAESSRAKFPSADALLMSKVSNKNTKLTAIAAILAGLSVFILELYTSRMEDKALIGDLKFEKDELKKRLEEKNTLLADRDRKIASVPSLVWGALKLIKRSEEPSAEQPPLK